MTDSSRKLLRPKTESQTVAPDMSGRVPHYDVHQCWAGGGGGEDRARVPGARERP